MSRVPATAIRRFFALLPLILALGGCYVPSDFKSLIQITSDGRYVFAYTGNLTSVVIVQALAKGTFSEAEIQKKIDGTRDDLARRPGFKSIDYKGQGRFEVDYEETGRLQEARSVNFVSQSSRILTMKYLAAPNTVTVELVKVQENYVRILVQLGLRPVGELRVRTDAREVEHNATRVAGNGVREYVWDIKGFRGPEPKLVLVLEPQETKEAEPKQAEAPEPAPQEAEAAALGDL